MEKFNNICAVYDGSILSKIKIIKLLSKLNSLDIYKFREHVESLLIKSINEDFETTKQKIENFFQNFIKSDGDSLELYMETSLVLSLYYQSTNRSQIKEWGLSIYFKDLIDKKEYILSVEIMSLLKFQKLKETSILKTRTEVSQPNFNKKDMVKDIEYIIKLLDITKESISIDSLSLKLSEKLENIKITPDMFDHVLKLIMKENGIWL
ncbi:hypothetical protein [Acinetobacter sp. NyZ410]|uniref:hypothetical protein n=1 Tax=Acinetobacter sp. NyZ410 TaxID=2929509 RepID=UPI001FBB1AF2|nr:hypothetical protein [Acinetobacter sp. NyZ410]UOH17177.1 hypothetical protein MTO68_15275 [Acinetobacter sp. NyZ410]